MKKKGMALDMAVKGALLLVVLVFGFVMISKGYAATKPARDYQSTIDQAACMEGIKLKYTISGKDVPSDQREDKDKDDVWDQCDSCVCISELCKNIGSNDEDGDGIYKGCDHNDGNANIGWSSHSSRDCKSQVDLLRNQGKPLRCSY